MAHIRQLQLDFKNANIANPYVGETKYVFIVA